MRTRSAVFAVAIMIATTLVTSTFKSSVYAGGRINHDGRFIPFAPVPFYPPCIPMSMLLDSVSVLSIQYSCSIPNTLPHIPNSFAIR